MKQTPDEILTILCDAATKLGLKVRFENLRKFHLKIDSGFCVLKEESTIFIDKKLKPREQIELLKTHLNTYDLNAIFLPDQTRELLSK